jgi:hypothetical protein
MLLEQFVARDGVHIDNAQSAATQSAADRIGMAPAEPFLNEATLQLIEKFQQLSTEKNNALLDLLE